jgi:hypothetical protein
MSPHTFVEATTPIRPARGFEVSPVDAVGGGTAVDEVVTSPDPLDAEVPKDHHRGRTGDRNTDSASLQPAQLACECARRW